MNLINLKLGGIEIAFDASYTIEQEFQPIESTGILRMANGAAVKQTAWSGKTKIITRGSGNIPTPLRGLDYSASMTMECSSARVAYSASTSVTVPAARRSDVSLIGQAIVNGRLVHSAIQSVVSNVATLTAVTGATGYQVCYWPTFTVFATPPTESSSARSLGSQSWSFEAEEV